MADLSSIGASASAFATNRATRIDRFFAKNDRDGDGKLSLDEFKAIGQKPPSGAATTASSQRSNAADLFKQIDSDGDGSITKDEMKTYRDQQVAQMRSAMLNLQEIFGPAESRTDREKLGGIHGRGHHHRPDQGEMPPANPLDNSATQANGTTDVVSALMKMLDTSNDGNISKEELSSFLQKMAMQA